MSPVQVTHEEAWQLLPWFANGSLERAEQKIVAAHLVTCADCRDEVERCRDVAAVAKAESGRQWAPSPEHVSRLLAKVEAIEAARGGAGGWLARLRSRLARLGDAVRETPTGVRWALAGQSVVVILLAGLVAWQGAAPGGPYRTLASIGEQFGRRPALARVVLSEDATEREIRALLESVGGRIVDGPSSVGAYTVELPVPASAPERLVPLVERLRADAKVRLAEPISVR